MLGHGHSYFTLRSGGGILETWIWTLLVVVPFLASCAVWYQLARRWQNSCEPVPHSTASCPPVNGLAAFFAAGWILFQLLGLFSKQPEAPSLQTVQVSCGTNVLLFVLLLGSLAGGDTIPADYGIRFRDFRRQAKWGALGFVASLLPVYSVLLLTMSLRGPESQHRMLRLLLSEPSPGTVVWICTAVIVLAPLTEELLFRVILQGWFRGRFNTVGAVLASSVIFSVVHGWPDLLPLFPLALILGFLYDRTRSYWAVVVLHALFNTFNLLLATMSVQ